MLALPDPLQSKVGRLCTMLALQDDHFQPKAERRFTALVPHSDPLPRQRKAERLSMAPAPRTDLRQRKVGRLSMALDLRRGRRRLPVSVKIGLLSPPPIAPQSPGPIKTSAKHAGGDRPRQAAGLCSALPPWTPRCLTRARSRGNDHRVPTSSSTWSG